MTLWMAAIAIIMLAALAAAVMGIRAPADRKIRYMTAGAILLLLGTVLLLFGQKFSG